MANNLNQVKIADFTRMAAARQAQIRLAVPRPLPSQDSYSANRLAAQLHPAVQHLVVSEVKDVQRDMRCYTMVPDQKAGTDHIAYFAAGQYLSLNLMADGMPVTRAYSICSSPRMALEGRIQIAVKRVRGGLVSNWILDHWRVGTQVEASGPLGTFTYEGIRDAPTVVGVAGGSGITPFLSMARAIADGDEDFRLVLLYGCRNRESAAFLDVLERIQSNTPKVRVVPVYSDEPEPSAISARVSALFGGADASDAVVPPCEHGFVTAKLIRKYAPQGEYSVFACGPKAMYDFLDTQLPQLGLRRKFVRRELMGELHGAHQLKGYPSDVDVPEQVQITVVREGESRQVEGSSDDSVLQILEKSRSGRLAAGRDARHRQARPNSSHAARFPAAQDSHAAATADASCPGSGRS